jgi:dynein heavy chain
VHAAQLKRDNLRKSKERLENGIDKIAQASSQVSDLQRVLKEEQIVVEEKKAQTDELIVSIGKEKGVVDAAVEAGREVRTAGLALAGRGPRAWRHRVLPPAFCAPPHACPVRCALVGAQDEEAATKLQEEVSAFQAECEKDLADAEPVIHAAEQALDSVKKEELSTLKALGSPPEAIVKVRAEGHLHERQGGWARCGPLWALGSNGLAVPG